MKLNNKFGHFLIVLTVFGGILPVFGYNYPLLDTNKVIHAVVMESSAEPYQAQVAICAVIRNRGSLHGVYGANAKRHESKKVYAQVTKAWIESATNDPTHGCDMFGGIIDDKYFKMIGLKPVMTIGHTRFYKSNSFLNK